MMNNSFFVNCRFFILMIIGLVLPSFVMAINVMPFSGELNLAEKSNYRIQITNRKNVEAAVKITVQKWSIDRFGKEMREPSNDLIVFPKHLLLSARGEKSVRVSYRKDISPRTEKSYRIIVEEIPLEGKKYRVNYKGASINVLTRYVTAFYVKPVNAFSEINVVESRAIENGFQLKIRNQGNAHTHFISPSITLSQNEKRIIISDIELLKDFSSTNIFALSDREYEWEIPHAFRDSLDFKLPYKVIIDWVCENCTKTKEKISFMIE